MSKTSACYSINPGASRKQSKECNCARSDAAPHACGKSSYQERDHMTIEELTRRNVTIIAEMEKAAAQVRTHGDRLADRLAAWAGSWTFLVTQTMILTGWIVLNLSAWLNHWDPYPFIL